MQPSLGHKHNLDKFIIQMSEKKLKQKFYVNPALGAVLHYQIVCWKKIFLHQIKTQLINKLIWSKLSKILEIIPKTNRSIKRN